MHKLFIKSFLSLLCFFGFSLAHSSGFDGDTFITTASGRLKPIRELSVNEEVVCYNKNLQQEFGKVKGIVAYTVDSIMEITTADNITLSASLTERFFLPKEGQWVFAKDLKEGDCLLNENLDFIAITSVHEVNEAQELLVVTIDKLHNFLASEGKYLAHNGPLAAWQAYWACKATLYGILGVAVAGTVVATGGAVAASAAAYTAGTATAGTIATGVACGIAEASVVAVSASGVGVAGAATTGAIVSGVAVAAGVEVGVAAGMATGATAIVTVSGSTAGAAAGVGGVCAATSAAIEAASIAAFTAALTCPWTPW